MTKESHSKKYIIKSNKITLGITENHHWFMDEMTHWIRSEYVLRSIDFSAEFSCIESIVHCTLYMYKVFHEKVCLSSTLSICSRDTFYWNTLYNVHAQSVSVESMSLLHMDSTEVGTLCTKTPYTLFCIKYLAIKCCTLIS